MAVAEQNVQVSPEALAPGTEVNGWRILAPLGGGGFGAAYRVESTVHPGEFFALKIARQLGDERLGREIALLMTRALHPHVVRLHGCGRWPHPATGYLYFVMDWVPGLPLHSWAETRNPTIRGAVEKLATVALALEHLHADGVLHRDLKPEHILIREPDGKPVLIDFGVGWYTGADVLTTQGMAPGTPHLRSPEAVAFWRKHGGRSGVRYAYKPTDEVYSLGVSAYRMLTGHWPFSAQLVWEELFRAIEGHVPPAPADINPRVPRAVSDVIMRMMARKPQDRFPSCAEVHVALVSSLSFAGAEVLETDLFAWEPVPGAQGAMERRVRLPEWPTLPQTTPEVRRKRSSWLQRILLRTRREKGTAATLPLLASEGEGQSPRVSRAWAGAIAGVLGLMVVGGLAVTLPTSGVGEKSSSLAGQKLASEPEWPEPSWAADPLRDPTSAVVAATTNPEGVPSVKTQKVNQATGQDVPTTPHEAETPTKSPLATLSKAAVLAATCTALAGCASGPPPMPPKVSPCPPGAWDNMRRLLMINSIRVNPEQYRDFGAKPRLITVREEKVVWAGVDDKKRATFPEGTKVAGQLWVRERLYGRFDRLILPDGQEIPVCLELSRRVDSPEATSWEPGVVFDEPSPEPGVAIINIQKLRPSVVREWGELRRNLKEW